MDPIKHLIEHKSVWRMQLHLTGYRTVSYSWYTNFLTRCRFSQIVSSYLICYWSGALSHTPNEKEGRETPKGRKGATPPSPTLWLPSKSKRRSRSAVAVWTFKTSTVLDGGLGFKAAL